MSLTGSSRKHERIQIMIEWLLTGINLVLAAFGGIVTSMTIIALILFKLPDKYFQEYYKGKGQYVANTLIVAFYAVPISIVFGTIFFASQITTEYISDSEWKEVYTNEIDADVTINLETNNGHSVYAVTGGKPLGDDYKTFSTYMNGTIVATKGDLQETKKIHIDTNDIVHENELTPTSKITKIEYKSVTKMYPTAFGYRGNAEKSDKDGIVRITISDDKSPERKELKSLFEN